MSFVTDVLDEKRATRAGTSDAAAGVDASNIERLLDSWSGPVQRADPENDLAQRRASFEAQRARNDLSEVEGEVRRLAVREDTSAFSPLMIAAALVLLFGVELVSATICLEGIGIPLRHRLAVAAAYSIGLLLLTRWTASFVERRAGILGWVGAIAATLLYASVIVLASAARFLGDENDLTVVELVVEGAVAALSVLGPAAAMHLASSQYLRARPAQNSRRAAGKREATLLRTLKSSHATLDRAQSATRETEVRRIRMKAAYLAAHRRELARVAQMNELLAKNAPETNPEGKK